MSHITYQYGDLKRFCEEAFIKFGFTPSESIVITDVLLLSDLYGIESHGIQRLVRYHKGIENGLINLSSKPEVIFDTPTTAVIEGNDGMGQLIGKYAMEKAIEKAKSTGVGIVTVRNSNHYGIAGFYARMAQMEGLIGISMTNSESIAVPTYGRKAMLGSNPFALSMPARPYPFLFDASTTVVTRGKLEVHNKRGQPIPIGWAIDKNGADTEDAGDVLDSIANRIGGGIVPLGGSTEMFGGHKGYGFGMAVEIFTSILSRGLTSNHTHQGNKGGACHSFIAINPAYFGEADLIQANLSKFLKELRRSDKAEGQNRIYSHGEKEALAYNDRLYNGIPVDMKTVEEMKDLCEYLVINFYDYFDK